MPPESESAATLPLFEDAARAPPGFVYRPDLVSRDEEAALVGRFEKLPFEPFDFRGFKGNRQTVAFGSRYDFTHSRVKTAETVPEWLRPLKARAAAVADIDDDALVQALVTEYPPGAGIGWHRDRPEYGKVIGISFASACILRFRRPHGDGWRRESVLLQPRSVYLLDGEVREHWQHSIMPGDRLRYSVTFRTLR
ncbi:alpha-ketoglutarate-dependent dioxygenase AlkB [Brevundimonas sp. BR2-1]|uniref:alpha-ketoglutarate-dependent dioxygenase AlkB n=1 Tax=Brevundimonas sp. BR2-1 TaxID=3031123 RepID=UPI00309FAB1C